MTTVGLPQLGQFWTNENG